ncbi:MAG: ferredoxin-type protein NapG [Desulfobulbaceae bacterium]|nr:ferredoxin-type protein NapG [Desulfobulbaceae bacterium]
MNTENNSTGGRQPKEPARRRFLAEAMTAAAGAMVLAASLGLYQRSARALPAYAFRPPGALPEEKFLGACLRCGQCVRGCPYDALRLAELGEEIPIGTPYFIARDNPCRMCEDIPCIKACPSGALNKNLPTIYESRMGQAVLLDHENCLNYLGLRCDVCYRTCPLIDKAITLEVQVNRRSGVHTLFIPTVHSDHCTGCGKCEYSCVLDNAAIKVLPIKQARGELGKHYRLGWEEKEKAGESLIPEQLKLPVRRPEELP